MVEEKEVKKNKKEVRNKKSKHKKKLSKNQIREKQIMWTVVLMGSLILIMVLVPFIVKNFINQFVYINLDFQKTKLGEIRFYSTRVPLADNQGQIIGTYSMNFRNDPRDLEDIYVDIREEPVQFDRTGVVYITLNPEMEACEDNSIAFIPFASFLRDFANINITSAVTEKDYAKEVNLPHVNCDNTHGNTILSIDSGDETKIEKIRTGCYKLTYSDCEVLAVTEKFELLILEEYMSYFIRN